MGIECSRDKDKEKSLELFNYQNSCAEIEKRLILPNLTIRELKSEIQAIKRSKGCFTLNGILEIYEKHGVARGDFMAPDSIYQDFLPDYNDCDQFEQYLLSTALPFSKGTINEKKEVLWDILKDQNQVVAKKILESIVDMMIALVVKTIPEIVIKEYDRKFQEITDKNLIMLVKCENEYVEKYA